MSPTLMAFLAVAMLVVGVYSILSDLYMRDRTRISQRVDDATRQVQHERAKKSAVFRNPQVLAIGDDEPVKTSLRQRFEVLVEQSGLAITPRHLLLIMIITGLCGAIVGLALRRSLLSGAIAAAVGFWLPRLYVVYKRKFRLAKLMAQLPDAFDLMARVIRAGQTVTQALQAVADEFDPPIGPEFLCCFEQQDLGLPPELALRDLARRTGLLEIKIFVLALLVQQQTGGNLAEVLDNLAAVIRDRFRIHGKIRALTAEGRLQAFILLALPPSMLLLILFLNHDYGQIMLAHPGLLIGIVVSELFGFLWIRKIINFDY